MWWEIIPSFSIIVGVLSVPAFVAPVMHKFFFDHKYRRERKNWYDRMYIRRDLRLTGDYYQLEGLDALPDAPVKPAPVKEQPQFKVKNPGPTYWMT